MSAKSAAFTLAILVAAAGLANGATIADLELDELWMGDAWDADALKDRVVLVEFWGYN